MPSIDDELNGEEAVTSARLYVNWLCPDCGFDNCYAEVLNKTGLAINPYPKT